MARMDPGSQLQTGLARVAAYGLRAHQAQMLRAAGDAGVFVCRQIGQTILGRRLVFSCDHVPKLACTVSGRRLMSIEFLSPDGAETERISLEDISETPDLDAGLKRVEKSLAGLGSSAEMISVRAEPLPAQLLPGHAGLPVRALVSRLGLSDAAPSPIEALQDLVARSGSDVIAAAILQDDMLHALAGGEAEMDRLAGIAEECLCDIEDLPGGLAGPLADAGLLCFGPHGAERETVMVAADGAALLIALTNEVALPRLSSAWYCGLAGP